MAFHVGQRLSFDGALCTVRFFGPLKGLNGEWLGIEWDHTTRGKHNGQHQGEQIFTCLSSSPTPASFIRPTRKLDPRRTLLEAIRHKYAASLAANGHAVSTKQNAIEISGKTVEEVGFEKIRQQISHLIDLKVALVDGLNLTGVARDASQKHSAQAELAKICPSITELDVGWNAIETWQDVADLTAPLGKLQVLKASGLRLRSFEAELLDDGTSPFKSVAEVHLNESLLKPNQIVQLLSSSGILLFPALKTLSLSQNEFSYLQPGSTSLSFDTITTLVLENNKFTSLDVLVDIFALFPKLQRLSLQDNSIMSIGSTLADQRFTTLDFLNIADNRISSFSFIDALPRIFPSLTSLRISKNPLYDQSNVISPSTTATASTEPTVTVSTLPPDSTYYLTLARIPSLLTLNYTTITTRDREEGEIYYLSVAEKGIRTTLSSNAQDNESTIQSCVERYPLYASLCEKYDRPNILTSPTPLTTSTPSSIPVYAPGTLGARLINATFYIPSPPSNTNPSTNYKFTRLLPPSMSVYTLKSLLARHFGLPPLEFRIIYETGELDPVMETTTKLGRGREDWERWGEWDVDVHPAPKTSDTDANALQVEVEDGGGEQEMDEDQWEDGYLLKDGVKWKKREVEIKDGMRGWGDYLENGVQEVRVRVEPFSERWREEREKWVREDLLDVMKKAGVGEER